MVYQWEPWTQYNTDAVVKYEGHLYKVIQGHQAEPNWQPPNTPALFSRVPEEEHDDYNSGRKHHGVEEHHRNQTPGGNQQQPQGGYNQGGDNQSQPEKKENWIEEHKLEAAGGLVGAVAIGAGIWAYSKHKNNEEEEAKRLAWQQVNNQDNWQAGAEKRTQHYEENGQRPPVYWVLGQPGQLPQNAIVGGQENGESLYVARAFYEGGLHPGKFSTHWPGASIAYGGKEHNVPKFEVLVGDPNAVRWIPIRGRTFVQGWTPVEGGREKDGTFLFVAQAEHKGGIHPGKTVDGAEHCNISWGGKEHLEEEYRVLAYA